MNQTNLMFVVLPFCLGTQAPREILSTQTHSIRLIHFFYIILLLARGFEMKNARKCNRSLLEVKKVKFLSLFSVSIASNKSARIHTQKKVRWKRRSL
jgi:hypothetical protein